MQTFHILTIIKRVDILLELLKKTPENMKC